MKSTIVQSGVWQFFPISVELFERLIWHLLKDFPFTILLGVRIFWQFTLKKESNIIFCLVFIHFSKQIHIYHHYAHACVPTRLLYVNFYRNAVEHHIWNIKCDWHLSFEDFLEVHAYINQVTSSAIAIVYFFIKLLRTNSYLRSLLYSYKNNGRQHLHSDHSLMYCCCRYNSIIHFLNQNTVRHLTKCYLDHQLPHLRESSCLNYMSIKDIWG